MKKMFLPLLMTGVMFSATTGLAQTSESFDKQAFLKEGLERTKDVLQDLAKDLTPAHSRGCPADGSQTLENLSSATGKIFSAVDRVDDVRDAIKPQVNDKRNDKSRCGSCQQNNVVSLFTSISPQEIQYSAQCEGRPTETLKAELKDKHDVKDFIEKVLTGRNSEGKRLHKACPDPCSFYVTTAETEENDRLHLTLTVQCGQPRKGSVFSARYNYNSGLVHQWTCSK